MKTCLNRVLVSTFLILFSASTLASLPYQGYKQVGQAKLKVLFWDIYTAYLYTPTGQYEGLESPLALRIVYHRDIEKKDLSDNTLDQWQSLFGDKQEYQDWLNQLNAIWPDLEKGDELSVMYSENTCRFYQKDSLLGSVSDKDLCSSFLSIWLSENASRPELRNKLIGGE